jgi:hypothetical protein
MYAIAFDSLLAENRARISVLGTAGGVSDSRSLPTTPPIDPGPAATPQPTPPPRIKADAPQTKPSAPNRPLVLPAVEFEGKPSPVSTKAPGEIAPLGRGGRQHQYLQNLLKLAAQERGFHAVIEEPVLEGAGRVDLSLTKDGLRIACEISVTTGVDWELGNVEKCIAAGYDQVILVAADERQRKALKKKVAARLDADTCTKVRCLSPDEVIALLDEDRATPNEEVVRGYKVRVTRASLDPEDMRRRREAIASILARSLKGQRKS